VLASLADELDTDLICYTRRYEPSERETEHRVRRMATGNLRIAEFDDQRLHPCCDVRTGSGSSFKIFTPFWKACLSLGEPDTPLAAPVRIDPFPSAIDSLDIDDLGLLPTKPDWSGGLRDTWSPGETAALSMLDRAAEIAVRYHSLRDRPDKDMTTRLSPYLHFGEVSPRQVWHAISRAQGAEALLRQLYWREFSTYLLEHNPTLPEQPLRSEFEHFPWVDDPEGFEAWTRGLTGYPLVDAGMRQLWETGWMHNRVRMIAASFLVKDLMIPWQQGAAWFMDTLVDADLANNSASWQWVAGCGTDAAPYFRIFNPTTQAKKFDPNNEYARRWLPETRDESAAYTPPIVNHDEARRHALASYQSMRDLLKSRAGESP
jgi:deoxyribodipyrimidine photo-lyase